MLVIVALTGAWVVFLIREMYAANSEIENHYKAHYEQNHPLSEAVLEKMRDTYGRYSGGLTVTIISLFIAMVVTGNLHMKAYSICLLLEAFVGMASFIFLPDDYSWDGPEA